MHKGYYAGFSCWRGVCREGSGTAGSTRPLTPSLVDSEADLAAANALWAFGTDALRMLGPPVGTFLVARGWFPAAVALALAAQLGAASVAAGLRVRGVRRPPAVPVIGGLRDGLAQVAGAPLLRGLLAVLDGQRRSDRAAGAVRGGSARFRRGGGVVGRGAGRGPPGRGAAESAAGAAVPGAGIAGGGVRGGRRGVPGAVHGVVGGGGVPGR
ncbi:hypothetical protein [Micromonospora sp. NPDC048830]|uniref:hypothetical protein n=1 Tax=Micromonospora sp. NPDC048830 TaxID=3364257 RepID=UPI00371714F5